MVHNNNDLSDENIIESHGEKSTELVWVMGMWGRLLTLIIATNKLLELGLNQSTQTQSHITSLSDQSSQK